MNSMTSMSHDEAEQLAKRNFFIHLGVYCAVNGGLAVLNLSRQPNNLWFVWPVAGWGIGVALHGTAVFVTGKAADRVLERQARREEREIRREDRLEERAENREARQERRHQHRG